MILYRCTLESHIDNTLSGEGAFRYSGRWNSKGVSVIYTAESRIMAVLELVIRQPIDKICSDFRILPIQTPDNFIQPKIPEDWKEDELITQRLGDSLLRNKDNLIIKVPSALLSNSYNYLINPLSADIKEVKILKPELILLDDRLLQALRK
jgi:RES domain-containing protein